MGLLTRMDRLANGITLLRGHGAQLWVFVQDLSQLKAVYPRWQSFLANTSQQFFGTADYDTARYFSGALGQQTIAFETRSSSSSDQGPLKPGSSSAGIGEHIQGRPLRSCGSVPPGRSCWWQANPPTWPVPNSSVMSRHFEPQCDKCLRTANSPAP